MILRLSEPYFRGLKIGLLQIKSISTMFQTKLLFSGITALILSLSVSNCKVTKPDVFEFGSSMAELKHKLVPMSDSITVQLNEPIQLPTAKKSQSQLNVYGFEFAGKKRKAELIFADDQLDMVWLLTNAEEEQVFIKDFIKRYGKPTHQMDEMTFFLNAGVGVRNQPHEVLFISERLKAPYKQWLDSKSN